KRQIPTVIRSLASSFIKNRTMSFHFDSHIEPPKPYNSGLPQGSPIFPILFLIYAQAMMEIGHQPPRTEVDVSYIDDDAMVQIGTNPKFCHTRLNERLKERISR